MTAGDAQEYTALRATIRERGTTRIWVFVIGLAIWAGLTIGTAALGAIPVTTLVPLLMLASTFEAVFALHTGVERIGRYLQVFCADRWEETAMAFGPAPAGSGTDPLFTAFFGLAALLNFGPVLVAGAVPVELAVIGAAHTLFLLRIVFGRRAASRQRAADLERYTLLHSRR